MFVYMSMCMLLDVQGLKISGKQYNQSNSINTTLEVLTERLHKS
jgi:hypothetical protein